MSPETMARANCWIVTLSHRGDYVAHDVHPDIRDDEPAYILDSDNEGDAWAELCRLEGIEEPTFGHCHPVVSTAS